jgi:hypothetical protein
MEYWSVGMGVPLPAVILPEVPGAIERDRITPDDADYLILGLS